MAARGGAMLQLQLQYNYIEDLVAKEFNEFVSKIRLGLGWLRAVAQGCNYSCNTVQLWSIF